MPMRTEPRSLAARLVLLLCIVSGRSITGTAGAQESPLAPGAAWEGRWQGILVNFPTRADRAPVEVSREVGPYPAADSTCSTWRTTYFEDGSQRGVKDYRLCRGNGPQDLYVDEGDGTRLTAGWLGDVLVTPFKFGDLLLAAMTRVDGESMLEEILTADDLAATTGVVPLRPRSLQRLTLRRAR